MAGNKKPKKKYTPRKVYYPQLINGFVTFLPLQSVLKGLLERNELLIDEWGEYIYYFGKEAKPIPVRLEIELFDDFMSIIEVRQKVSFNLEPFRELRRVIEAKEPFEEELVEKALALVEKCQQVASTIPQKLSWEIIQSIRVKQEMERVEREKQRAAAGIPESESIDERYALAV